MSCAGGIPGTIVAPNFKWYFLHSSVHNEDVFFKKRPRMREEHHMRLHLVSSCKYDPRDGQGSDSPVLVIFDEEVWPNFAKTVKFRLKLWSIQFSAQNNLSTMESPFQLCDGSRSRKIIIKGFMNYRSCLGLPTQNLHLALMGNYKYALASE